MSKCQKLGFPNFTLNIKQNLVNQLAFIPPEIIRKP